MHVTLSANCQIDDWTSDLCDLTYDLYDWTLTFVTSPMNMTCNLSDLHLFFIVFWSTIVNCILEHAFQWEKTCAAWMMLRPDYALLHIEKRILTNMHTSTLSLFNFHPTLLFELFQQGKIWNTNMLHDRVSH